MVKLEVELTAERVHGTGSPDEQQEGAQPAEWLQGIDDLAPGSFDLLTVLLLN